MEMRKKRTNLCFLTLIVAAFSVLLVHGCSFSEYDLVVEDSSDMVLEEANSTRALSEQNCRNDLVISVSESEEYLDYLMSLHMFFDKFDSYYSSLNDKEKIQLEENLNNDDYIEDIIDESCIRNELEQMINAQNQLKNTAYFHLNKLERSMLISLDCTYIHKTVLLKTRGEGDDARKCAEIRDKAIQAASDLAIKEKEACDDAYESGTTVHAYCYFKAAKKFSKAKEETKEEYERCIGK